MSDYNTNDNFEEIIPDDFLSSKKTFTHFYIDADLSNLSDTKTKLKELGCSWSTAYKKYVAVVSHRSQVETLLNAKQIAFSLEYTSDPFVSSDKKEISIHNQIDIITEQIVKEDEKITLLAYRLKLETDDFKKEPALGDAFYTQKHDGYELYKSVAKKKALRQELYAKLDGMQEKKETVKCVQASESNTNFIIKVRSYKELRQLPKKQWIIENVLVKKDLVMIYGSPGCGKTFIAIDLIAHAITGKKWADKFHVSKPLNVAYCTSEGLQSITERFDAAFIKQNIDEEIDNFYFIDTLPQLFNMKAKINAELFISEWIERIKQGTQKQLDIIFIDTFHGATLGAKENCTMEMGLVIEMCKTLTETLDTAVILIHHSTKDGTVERGSTSIRGGMDTMIHVKDHKIHCSKTKHGKDWFPIAFQLVEVPGTDNACVEWCEYTKPSQTENQKQEKNWLAKVLKFFNENRGKFYTTYQISDELGWSFKFLSKALKEGLHQGVYNTSAVDPSKSVNSKNPQTYGIK
jgi:DNA replication protein DnaC